MLKSRGSPKKLCWKKFFNPSAWGNYTINSLNGCIYLICLCFNWICGSFVAAIKEDLYSWLHSFSVSSESCNLLLCLKSDTFVHSRVWIFLALCFVFGKLVFGRKVRKQCLGAMINHNCFFWNLWYNFHWKER